MKKAVYPGSFDPVSNGHLDIIKRASLIFDEVHILVSNNIHKHTVFSVFERIELLRLSTSKFNNIKIVSDDDLVVNYCKNNDINIIIRGLRNFQDYEQEFSLFQFNRDIYPKIETLFFFPTTKNQVVSSSAVKELISFGVDISPYVPKEIIPYLIEKFNNKK